MLETVEKQFVKVGEINLHVISAGAKDGEPIIFLHGFPDFWYGWRKQIPYFVARGYRVIVPDQRGYNVSDKPEAVRDYQADLLAEDIAHLIDVLDYERVHLVGHDWGGAVAWRFAEVYPDKLKRLIILNVPHPIVMKQALQSGNISQWLRSWYMGFFQLPFLPETLVGWDDYQGFSQQIQQDALPQSFTDEDLGHYRRAWSQPHALRSMIHWYRALTVPSRKHRTRGSITTPTLLLWGEKDTHLGKELAHPSIERCIDGELVFFPNATHWIQLDAADSVNEEIAAFIAQADESVTA